MTNQPAFYAPLVEHVAKGHVLRTGSVVPEAARAPLLHLLSQQHASITDDMMRSSGLTSRDVIDSHGRITPYGAITIRHLQHEHGAHVDATNPEKGGLGRETLTRALNTGSHHTVSAEKSVLDYAKAFYEGNRKPITAGSDGRFDMSKPGLDSFSKALNALSIRIVTSDGLGTRESNIAGFEGLSLSPAEIEKAKSLAVSMRGGELTSDRVRAFQDLMQLAGYKQGLKTNGQIDNATSQALLNWGMRDSGLTNSDLKQVRLAQDAPKPSQPRALS